MSAAGGFALVCNYKYIIYSGLAAFTLISAASGQAEPTPTPSQEPPTMRTSLGENAGGRTIGELRSHAATISEILETASERVELLAATDADAPELFEAIKHELSLSRQWNGHLETILDDVAEARLALSQREREAAKEITHLTALAEEARLELVELKKVLKESPDEAVQSQDTWSEGRLSEQEAELGTRSQTASNLSISDHLSEGPDSFNIGAIKDDRAMLDSIEAVEASLVSDVDAVRTKIIEALEILATVRGDLPARTHNSGAALSSEDITGWAASMATRLNKASKEALTDAIEQQ